MTPTYVEPTIEDYGTLEELVCDPSLAAVGMGHTSQLSVSVPVGPGGGGGGGGHGAGAGVGGVNHAGVPGSTPSTGYVGDTTAGSTPAGASPGASGGAGAGGVGTVGSSGGGSGKLPFTGFPVALAAAAGAGLAVAGAGLRRILSRDV